jgi:hypothetical protein
MYDALKAQLVALIKIRRHVTGEHRQEKWKNDQRLRAKLPAILDMWESRVSSHELPEAQVEEVLHGTGRGLRWWRQQLTIPSRALCDHEIEAVKKLLQGRARTDLRKRISRKVRQRELLRKSGQWRGVIKSLLGSWAGARHRDAVGMDVLRKRDGSTTSTAKEANALLREEYQAWFGCPELHRRGIHTRTDWTTIGSDEAAFMADTEYTGVPLELRRKMFIAMGTMAGGAKAKVDLDKAFETPPTAEEWHAMVGEMKNNSSGGMTGCSYNMIKCWPVEISTAVYNCLVRCWMDKTLPVAWKWRWLIPIPKKR